MRSRIAILATLALGMVLSTGGAGLAVSGFASQTGNAAGSQYGTPTPTPESTTEGGGGNVLGEEESGGPAGGGGNESTPAGEETQSQPARQVEAGAQSGAAKTSSSRSPASRPSPSCWAAWRCSRRASCSGVAPQTRSSHSDNARRFSPKEAAALHESTGTCVQGPRNVEALDNGSVVESAAQAST